jgi:hypothetical protein
VQRRRGLCLRVSEFGAIVQRVLLRVLGLMWMCSSWCRGELWRRCAAGSVKGLGLCAVMQEGVM